MSLRKSKLQILFEEVLDFVDCWYDGSAPFIEKAMKIQFLPKRVAFLLDSLLKATADTDNKTVLNMNLLLTDEVRSMPRHGPPPPPPSPTSPVSQTSSTSPTSRTLQTSPKFSTELTISDYIKRAHVSTQKLCKIALGHEIDADRTNITISSLTEIIRTLTMSLLDNQVMDHSEMVQKTQICPVS